jgi:dihydroorotate dehydrogenase (NAD+) catalytic subunit
MPIEAATCPELTTTLGPRIRLRSPLLAAAGSLGLGDRVADLADYSALGALVTATITPEPREGNPPPRTAEASAGLVHAAGLPNCGIDAFLTTVWPGLTEMNCQVWVSIAASSPGEWAAAAERLEGAGVPVIELNLAPEWIWNSAGGRIAPGSENEILKWIGETVAAVRSVVSMPIVAKLPAIGAEIGAAAVAAVDAGADLLCVSSAFPAVVVRPAARSFRFPGVVGALSGPAIKPLALYQVWRAAQAVRVPIIGVGGVMTYEDALEMLLAGASAVGLGTALLIHPNAAARILSDLRAHMLESRLSSLGPLIGAANPPT